MKRTLCAILIATSGALAPAGFTGAQQPPAPPQPQAQPQPAATPEQIQKWKEEAAEKARRAGEERMLEQEAFWARAMPQVVAPAGVSPWLDAEMRFHADLVALAPAKVIVLPPTMPEGESGIDLTSRITIARLLAQQIEASEGPVPDPGLVYRAFGEARTITPARVREQLARSQAQWFIVGSVRRNGDRLQLSFTRIPARVPGATEPEPAFRLDNLEIGNQPPELRVAPYLADAVAALGYKAPAASGAAKPAPLALPATLGGTPDTGDLGGVWLQQMLGALIVPYLDGSQRAQERVFERSLAAALAQPSQAPDRAVLLARSLAYLDRREAAVKALASGAATPEGKALAAYLAADLPALEAAITALKRPAARLISQLELLRLRNSFRAISQGEIAAQAQKLAASVPAAWQPLVAAHVATLSLWTMPPSLSLKPVLDRDFPVPGYALEDLARGKAALGASGVDEKLQAELLLSPISHAGRWRRANMKDLCCRGTAAALHEAGRGEVLDLVEADAELLALARLEFLGRVQGLPDQMRRLADRYDEVLFNGGHPGVAQQRMDMAYRQSFRAPQERARLWTEAFENARRVLTWDTAQGLPTANALAVRRATYASYVGAGFVSKEAPGHAVELDVPVRAFFARRAGGFLPLSQKDASYNLLRGACADTVAYFALCEEYVKALQESPSRKAQVDAEVKALVAPRFNGSGERLELMAAIESGKGRAEASRKLRQQATLLPGAPMGAFEALAKALLAEGDLAGAGAAYLRYPGLKAGQDGSVGISNYASGAGYALARVGAIREARPLLLRAAENADGSYASLWSASELALMDGDYDGSLGLFRQAYQRYREPASVRAIASLLFATGEREAAWGALGEVPPTSRDASPRRAVAVGLRIAGTEPDALLQWYNGELKKLSGTGQRFPDPTFLDFSLLQTVLTDREAGAYDGLFDELVEAWMARNRPPGAPVVPKAERKFKPPDPMGPNAGPFRQGYDAFRRGNHPDAVEAWGRMVKSFDAASYPPRFADENGDMFWSGMPYYAISLVKSGRAAEAANLHARLTRDGRPGGSPPVSDMIRQIPMPQFERRMISGIVAAYAGSHAAAQAHFRAARGSMAEPGGRILPPDYVYAEILEHLARETNQRAYLTMALDFARAFRQYEPWASWACAFEAAHSAGPEQLRAAACALKLDPKSMRLQRVDARVLERARDQLAREDPFQAKPPARKRAGQPTT